jgi:hypothetical protein
MIVYKMIDNCFQFNQFYLDKADILFKFWQDKFILRTSISVVSMIFFAIYAKR